MVRPRSTDMGWNKDKVYDRVRASMTGVCVSEDTSWLRENRSEKAVS